MGKLPAQHIRKIMWLRWGFLSYTHPRPPPKELNFHENIIAIYGTYVLLCGGVRATKKVFIKGQNRTEPPTRQKSEEKKIVSWHFNIVQPVRQSSNTKKELLPLNFVIFFSSSTLTSPHLTSSTSTRHTVVIRTNSHIHTYDTHTNTNTAHLQAIRTIWYWYTLRVRFRLEENAQPNAGATS